jgi:ketosteroid isomerase-like protein
MTERDEFIAWVQSTLRDAEMAVHNGDAGPRRAIWSRNDPVTVLGAWKNASGQQELNDLFADLAESFSDCTSYELELLEAEVCGDIAYTAGFEHTSASVNGVPRTYTLRATRSTGVRTASGRWRTATEARRHSKWLPLLGAAGGSRQPGGAICDAPPRALHRLDCGCPTSSCSYVAVQLNGWSDGSRRSGSGLGHQRVGGARGVARSAHRHESGSLGHMPVR